MNYPLTPAELDALAAWWQAGTVTGAAVILGRSVQTVKNQLADARRRSQADSNLAALKANWRAVGTRHPDLFRRLRYQFDAAYRDRVRIQSREAMRRLLDHPRRAGLDLRLRLPEGEGEPEARP